MSSVGTKWLRKVLRYGITHCWFWCFHGIYCQQYKYSIAAASPFEGSQQQLFYFWILKVVHFCGKTTQTTGFVQINSGINLLVDEMVVNNTFLNREEKVKQCFVAGSFESNAILALMFQQIWSVMQLDVRICGWLWLVEGGERLMTHRHNCTSEGPTQQHRKKTQLSSPSAQRKN